MLAIAIVLGRTDWIRANGCRDLEAARGVLGVQCHEATQIIKEAPRCFKWVT
jgi:hypothetical protein